MIKVLLIRHGEAAKNQQVSDPTLTDLGHRQAKALAEQFGSRPSLDLVSSPMARARQTAQPLAARWQKEIIVEPKVTEIPSPLGLSAAQRGEWIRGLLDQQWDQLEAHQLEWRQQIMEFLQGLQQDSAVFCHFMVINSVVAHLQDDLRIKQFRPDYTSITELRLNNGTLELVQLGANRSNRIL